MKITDVKLYTVKSGDTGARGAVQDESQYGGGGYMSTHWIAVIAKPYGMPVIPHGSSVYNYHFVMANTNSPYAEYLSVGKGTDVQPIFNILEGELLPENGVVSLNHDKPGFGVELKRELLAPSTG